GRISTRARTGRALGPAARPELPDAHEDHDDDEDHPGTTTSHLRGGRPTKRRWPDDRRPVLHRASLPLGFRGYGREQRASAREIARRAGILGDVAELSRVRRSIELFEAVGVVDVEESARHDTLPRRRALIAAPI